jgi:hypothetical protein
MCQQATVAQRDTYAGVFLTEVRKPTRQQPVSGVGIETSVPPHHNIVYPHPPPPPITL